MGPRRRRNWRGACPPGATWTSPACRLPQTRRSRHRSRPRHRPQQGTSNCRPASWPACGRT
eukprot:11214639-Lingulodinium_polyedra.AAC.1